MTDKRKLRIAVAEDDDLNLMILTKILESAGHVSLEFSDGHLILEYLCENPKEVDVVILDKMMVQMHGLEVVRHMKNHVLLKNIPIIIQSGDVFPDKIKEALDAGVDRYITKPFEDFQLLEMIQDLAQQYELKTIQPACA